MVKGQTVPTTGDTITVGVTPSRVVLFRRSDGQRLVPNANRPAINIKQASEETQPC